MRLHLIPAVQSSRCCLAPHAATASNFTVTPTEVDLSPSATSALVTLRNSEQGAAAIRGHARQLVRGRAWPDDAEPVI